MARAPAELWTAAICAAADRYTMDTLGVPSPVLMERAAVCVAREVVAAGGDEDGPAICLAGPGNNGGDAVAVARILTGWGRAARVLLATERGNAAREEQIAWARACGVSIDAVESGGLPEVAGAWVDGLLGTGSQGEPRGAVARVLAALRGRAGARVAVDLPSGLDPDRGIVSSDAFRADRTVTFGRSKPGLHVTPGRTFAGRVVVADMGLWPPPRAGGPGTRLIDPAQVAAGLAALPVGPHKGARGHLGVLAGGRGTPGAAVLAGAAALRAGVGVVTVETSAPEVRADLVARRPELMVRAPEGGQAVPGAQALVVGPGLTDSADAERLAELWRGDPRPAVWDAAALDAIPLGAPAAGPRVVTPHPGEAARILARAGGEPTSAAEVQAGRLEALDRLVAALGCVVVLKGEGTLVGRPDGAVALATEGSEALSTAGTGDVLAGLCGALLARGLDVWSAAQAAVHIHALAGEAAAARGVPGALAWDVVEALPAALSRGEQAPGWPRLVRG